MPVSAPDHEYFMQQALLLAEQAAALGEVPVGAVVVNQNEIVGRGFNQSISGADPSAHAEIVALRDAATTLKNYRLPACDLYVTIEPCMMCAGAIVHARIRTLYYGALEPKAGVVESNDNLFARAELNHTVATQGGVLAEQSRSLIQQFFAERRTKNKTL